jgi:hypothetical protein
MSISSELNTRFNLKNLKNIRKIDEPEVALWPRKFSMYREKMNSSQRATFGAFLTNLRVSMPLSKKLWLIFKNQWIKTKNFESCCHHPGEPAGGGPLANGT